MIAWRSLQDKACSLFVKEDMNKWCRMLKTDQSKRPLWYNPLDCKGPAGVVLTTCRDPQCHLASPWVIMWATTPTLETRPSLTLQWFSNTLQIHLFSPNVFLHRTHYKTKQKLEQFSEASMETLGALPLSQGISLKPSKLWNTSASLNPRAFKTALKFLSLYIACRNAEYCHSGKQCGSFFYKVKYMHLTYDTILGIYLKKYKLYSHKTCTLIVYSIFIDNCPKLERN